MLPGWGYNVAGGMPPHLGFQPSCPGQDVMVAPSGREGDVRQGGRRQQQRRQRLLGVHLRQRLVDQPHSEDACTGGKGHTVQPPAPMLRAPGGVAAQGDARFSSVSLGLGSPCKLPPGKVCRIPCSSKRHAGRTHGRFRLARMNWCWSRCPECHSSSGTRLPLPETGLSAAVSPQNTCRRDTGQRLSAF